jgi:hypothetical protein
MISGIFVTEHEMANMTMERIVVTDYATQEILKITKLPLDDQQEAVDALVHRTAEWNDLEPEDQIEKIKFVLTTETVLMYLQAIDAVRNQVDVLNLGVDEEGSIVVYAYYTNMNRAQRRAMIKGTTEKKKEELVNAVSQFDKLSQQGNIIDLAKKKIEKMAAEKAKVKK